eukprot:922922_1
MMLHRSSFCQHPVGQLDEYQLLAINFRYLVVVMLVLSVQTIGLFRMISYSLSASERTACDLSRINGWVICDKILAGALSGIVAYCSLAHIQRNRTGGFYEFIDANNA